MAAIPLLHSAGTLAAPLLLSPQAMTRPLFVKAKEWYPPEEIARISERASVGTPVWPYWLFPHTKTFPAAVKAME